MTPSVNALLMVPLFKRLAAKAPHVMLEPFEELSQRLVDWVADGELDMAIAFQVGDRPDLTWKPLLGEPMFFVESAQKCRRSGDTISFADAIRDPLVATVMSPWFRSLLDQRARAKGLKLRIMHHMHSVATLRDLVAQGVAPTILPYGVVMREIASGTLRAFRIVDPEIIRDLCLVQSQARPMSDAAQAVRSHIECLVADTLSKPDEIWQPIREPEQTGVERQLFVDGLARRRLRGSVHPEPATWMAKPARRARVRNEA